MDTTAANIGRFNFENLTASDILLGPYDWHFMVAALLVALFGFLSRKYWRFTKATNSIEDFDPWYWLANNAVNTIAGFPIAWVSVIALDFIAPMILNFEIVKVYITEPENVPVPVVVIIVMSVVGWMIDKYVPSAKIKKLQQKSEIRKSGTRNGLNKPN